MHLTVMACHDSMSIVSLFTEISEFGVGALEMSPVWLGALSGAVAAATAADGMGSLFSANALATNL